MNLEEIEKRYDYRNANGDFFYEAIVCAEKVQLVKDMSWLIFQRKEKDREVANARKQGMIDALTASMGAIKDLIKHIKEKGNEGM